MLAARHLLLQTSAVAVLRVAEAKEGCFESDLRDTKPRTGSS
jgi:hypothetical protein